MVKLQRNFRNDGFAYNFPIVYITANDSLLKVSQFSTKNMPLNLSLILTAIYQKFEKKVGSWSVTCGTHFSACNFYSNFFHLSFYPGSTNLV